MYPSRLLKNIKSISPKSSLHKILFGRFLILGKLYFTTLIFTVKIFPTSSLSKVVEFDLSVREYGKSQSKSFTFSIFFFF